MQGLAVAELLAEFGRAMRRRRWRWYVFGGQAVLAWGRPRLTADVDITVDLAGAVPREMLDALDRSGFALRFPLSNEFVASARLFPLVHRRSGTPVDVVVASSELERIFLGRRRSIKSGAGKVPLISAEDLVATKILAGRRKDLEDARGVLLEQSGRFDLARTRSVVAALDRIVGGDKLGRRLERLVRTTARSTRGATVRSRGSRRPARR